MPAEIAGKISRRAGGAAHPDHAAAGRDRRRRRAPAERRKAKNPARRTFQAIRIAVNSELDALNEGLTPSLTAWPRAGGGSAGSSPSTAWRIDSSRTSSAAGHSADLPAGAAHLHLRWCGQAKLITRKPIIEADAAELETNRRSRSAKLRVLRKHKRHYS